MRLSEQAISLEQAKKLKDLGVVQESYFYYQHYPKTVYIEEFMAIVSPLSKEGVAHAGECWSAFTVAELGVMIGWDYVCTFYAYGAWHWCDLRNEEPMSIAKSYKRKSQTEAEARANMLICLLENNHITVEEVNQRLNAKQ